MNQKCAPGSIPENSRGKPLKRRGSEITWMNNRYIKYQWNFINHKFTVFSCFHLFLLNLRNPINNEFTISEILKISKKKLIFPKRTKLSKSLDMLFHSQINSYVFVNNGTDNFKIHPLNSSIEILFISQHYQHLLFSLFSVYSTIKIVF